MTNDSLDWLEADGMGGFACGSINGEIRRKWHGLFWEALNPPRNRVLGLVGLFDCLYDEETGERLWLTSHWESGHWHAPTLKPYFEIRPFPTWIWDLPNGGKLWRTIWMTRHEQPFVGLQYIYRGPETKMVLSSRPILPQEHREIVLSTPVIREVLVQIERLKSELAEGRIPEEVTILSDLPEEFGETPELDEETREAISNEIDNYARRDIDDVVHPRKLLRSVTLEIEKDCEDVHTANLQLGQAIRIRLVDGYPIDFAYSSKRLAVGTDLDKLREAERLRRKSLVVMGIPDDYHYIEAPLALAADRFLVNAADGRWTILAGYPWFTDWGRDAMISIPGLCLATSRLGEARDIIRHFLEHLEDGIIPNLFPERDQAPMYNTVDATLWLIEMMFRCWTPKEIADDRALSSSLRLIIEYHENETRHGIHEDSDGLLHAGAPGTQLTWMDVKVNGEVPTPRHGKAVEIQGLWYNARLLAALAAEAAGDHQAAERQRTAAARTRASFAKRFFTPSTPWAADVVDRDEDGEADFSLRPNMVIPFALRHNILPEDQRPAILQSVADHLLTPRGLRTLAPSAPGYKGIYRGNVVTRDHAYHQGTVWTWILWPWVRGVHDHRDQVPELAANLPALRKELIHHFYNEGCFEGVNEIFDGDAPHQPRGCFTQAWSVSALIEILRTH